MVLERYNMVSGRCHMVPGWCQMFSVRCPTVFMKVFDGLGKVSACILMCKMAPGMCQFVLSQVSAGLRKLLD